MLRGDFPTYFPDRELERKPIGICFKVFDFFAIANSCAYFSLQSAAYVPLLICGTRFESLLWTSFLVSYTGAVFVVSVLLAFKRKYRVVRGTAPAGFRWVFRKSILICFAALSMNFGMILVINVLVSEEDMESFGKSHGAKTESLAEYDAFLRIANRGTFYATYGSFTTTFVNVLWFLREYTNRVEELKDLRTIVRRISRLEYPEQLTPRQIRAYLRYPLYRSVKDFKMMSTRFSEIIFSFFFIFGTGVMLPVFSFAMQKEFSVFGVMFLTLMAYSIIMLFAITGASEDARLVQTDVCHLLGQIMGRGPLDKSTTKVLHHYKECFWAAKVRLDSAGVSTLGVASWVEVLTVTFGVSLVLYQVSAMSDAPACNPLSPDASS